MDEAFVLLAIMGVVVVAFGVALHEVVLMPEYEANIECRSRGYVEAISYPSPLTPNQPLVCTGTAVVIREGANE